MMLDIGRCLPLRKTGESSTVVAGPDMSLMLLLFHEKKADTIAKIEGLIRYYGNNVRTDEIIRILMNEDEANGDDIFEEECSDDDFVEEDDAANDEVDVESVVDSENESEIIVTESKTSGKRKRVGCNGNAQALKKGKKSDNCWFTQEGTIVTPKKRILIGKNGHTWHSEPPPLGKTPERNIVMRMPGPKRAAKEAITSDGSAIGNVLRLVQMKLPRTLPRDDSIAVEAYMSEEHLPNAEAERFSQNKYLMVHKINSSCLSGITTTHNKNFACFETSFGHGTVQVTVSTGLDALERLNWTPRFGKMKADLTAQSDDFRGKNL
ncbi:hypothetical protein C0J52_17938 [Blattella germanica]|nr:hypothetical protein C0J52_17938 [Blattella germanica]